MRMTTKNDVIDQIVTPALGEFADEHDIDATADEAFAYRVDRNDRGQELLNTAGFEQIVDEDEFWAIVKRHAL